MELCEFNLEKYIPPLWEPTSLEKMQNSIDWSSRIKYIGSIMGEIASGVSFIHLRKMVHRDIKPRNGIVRFTNWHVVLFSGNDHRWKIANFGISSEGATNKAVTTEYARGTPSYRALELLNEHKYSYTNKVDIWAMGCILYEILFRVKAFSEDMSVREHYLSK